MDKNGSYNDNEAHEGKEGTCGCIQSHHPNYLKLDWCFVASRERSGTNM